MVDFIAFEVSEMSNVMRRAIASNAVCRHAASFGKEHVEKCGRPGLGFPPNTKVAREDPLNPDFRSYVGRDGETDGCCRMRVTRFSHAASKARPQRTRDRRKLASASHDVNATKRLQTTDVRDNGVDDS